MINMIIATFQASNLTNGLRTNIVLVANEKQNFTISVTARDNLRYYFEAMITATITFYKHQSDVIIYNSSQNTTHVMWYEQYKDLYDTQFDIVLFSPTTQSIYITVHSAIELTPWRAFVQSTSIVAPFISNSRIFAFFVGLDLPVIVDTQSAVGNVKTQFRAFTGDEQVNEAPANYSTAQFTIDTTTLKHRVGWLYISIESDAQYTLTITQQPTNEVISVNQQQRFKYSLFYESAFHFQVLTPPTDFPSNNVTLTAFTSHLHNSPITISFSTQTRPGGLIYATDGSAKQFQAAQGQRGIIAIVNGSDPATFPAENCDAERKKCWGHATLSQETRFMLCRDNAHYGFFSVDVAMQKDAVFAGEIPAHIKFSATKELAISISMQQQKIQLQGADKIAYVMQVKHSGQGSVRGVLSNNSIPGQGRREMSMSRISNGVQQLVDASNRFFFSLGGTYYASISSDQQMSGEVRAGLTHEILIGRRTALLDHTGPVSYFAKVAGRFTSCLEVLGEKPVPGSFKIFSSTADYIPTQEEPTSWDWESGDGFLMNGTTFFCVSGEVLSPQIVHFRLFISKEVYFQNAFLTVGQEYYYIKAVPIGVKMNISADNQRVFHVRLQPTFYDSKKRSILQHKIYLELNFDELSGDAQVTIQQMDKKQITFQSDIKKVANHFHAELKMPIDRELLVNITMKDSATLSFNGTIFFQYLYNMYEHGVEVVRFTDSPVIIQVDLRQQLEPIIHLFSGSARLSYLQAFICKGQPKLSANDNVPLGCYQYKFDQDNQSIAIPYDSSLTSNIEVFQGLVFISILPIVDFENVKTFSFEVTTATTLKMNTNNSVTPKNDPIMTAYGPRQHTYVIFDIVKEVYPKYQTEIFMSFSAELTKICVSPTPLSYSLFTMGYDCIQEANNAKNITIQMQPVTQRSISRLYINILGGPFILAKTMSVYVTGYQLLTPESEADFQLFCSGQRTGDTEFIVKITAQEQKQIQIINSLDVTDAEYEELYASGKSDASRLSCAEDIFFSKVKADDSHARQILLLDGQKENFVKVELRKFSDLHNFRLQVGQLQRQKKLYFIKTIENNITNMTAANFFLHACHTPMQLRVDVCKAEIGSKFTIAQSAFYVEPNMNSNVDIVQSNASQFVLDIPNNLFQYNDINFFIGIWNLDSNSSFRTTLQTGQNFPSIPKDQQVKISKFRGLQIFRIRFRPAWLSSLRGYDGILNVGFKNILQPGISYMIYANNIDKIESSTILDTECGLEQNAINVTDWMQYDSKENSKIVLNFSCGNTTCNEKTQFILLAKNNILQASKAYKPVNWTDVELTVIMINIHEGDKPCPVMLNISVGSFKCGAQNTSLYNCSTDLGKTPQPQLLKIVDPSGQFMYFSKNISFVDEYVTEVNLTIERIPFDPQLNMSTFYAYDTFFTASVTDISNYGKYTPGQQVKSATMTVSSSDSAQKFAFTLATNQPFLPNKTLTFRFLRAHCDEEVECLQRFDSSLKLVKSGAYVTDLCLDCADNVPKVMYTVFFSPQQTQFANVRYDQKSKQVMMKVVANNLLPLGPGGYRLVMKNPYTDQMVVTKAASTLGEISVLPTDLQVLGPGPDYKETEFVETAQFYDGFVPAPVVGFFLNSTFYYYQVREMLQPTANVAMIVGLSVGIPCAVVAACIVVIVILRQRRKNKETEALLVEQPCVNKQIVENDNDYV